MCLPLSFKAEEQLRAALRQYFTVYNCNFVGPLVSIPSLSHLVLTKVQSVKGAAFMRHIRFFLSPLTNQLGLSLFLITAAPDPLGGCWANWQQRTTYVLHLFKVAWNLFLTLYLHSRWRVVVTSHSSGRLTSRRPRQVGTGQRNNQRRRRRRMFETRGKIGSCPFVRCGG